MSTTGPNLPCVSAAQEGLGRVGVWAWFELRTQQCPETKLLPWS